ncbi:hypothetical protein Q3G72_016444 [Acer saccharum]|nr:hypothetical protein Q3G72_016444 [Acer saccharum]
MHLKFGVVPVIVFSSAEAARGFLKIHDLKCSCTRQRLTGTRSIILRMAFGKKFRGSNFDNNRFQDLVQAASVIGDHAKAEKSKEEAKKAKTLSMFC